MSSKLWKEVVLNIEFYTKPSHQSSVRVEEKHVHMCKALTFFFKFIYFETDRETEREREREKQRGERENPKQDPHCQHRDQCRAQTHEL